MAGHLDPWSHSSAAAPRAGSWVPRTQGAMGLHIPAWPLLPDTHPGPDWMKHWGDGPLPPESQPHLSAGRVCSDIIMPPTPTARNTLQVDVTFSQAPKCPKSSPHSCQRGITPGSLITQKPCLLGLLTANSERSPLLGAKVCSGWGSAWYLVGWGPSSSDLFKGNRRTLPPREARRERRGTGGSRWKGAA